MGLRERVVNLISPPQRNADLGISTGSYNLANNNSVVVDSSKPLGKKTTPETSRVPKIELEASYRHEPNVFNAVNKTVQVIMAAGYRLVGEEESVGFFTDFFANIGHEGGEMEWEELLTSIFKHQMVYGEAWNELIPAKRDPNKIVDLQLIDAKKMDYAKDGDNKIVLDSYGDPVGYVETLPLMYETDAKGVAPKEVDLGTNQIFFPPKRIAHYKLYTIGDSFYGIGLIEPSYKQVVRKLSMEEALANSVNRTGFPIKKAKIGDINHEPTEELIQRTVEKLRGMDYRDVIAFPYWVDYGIVESQNPEKLQEHLDYYINQIVTGTGLPKALATGGGEETNRATLDRQEALAKHTMKDIVRRTTMIIEKKIIQPVAEANNKSPVKINWGEIEIEELDARAERLARYTQAGLLTPDSKIEALIRNIEDLPMQDAKAGGANGAKADKASP